MEIKDVKDLLSYLDVKESDITVDGKLSMDKFKEVFNGDNGFFRKNQLEDLIKGDEKLKDKITGTRVGAIETALKRTMKAHGIEFDEETEKAGIEKKVDVVFKTIAKTKDDAIKTLKAELDLKDVDAAVKEYKDKYLKLEGKHRDVDEMLKKTASELEAERKKFIDFEKSFAVKSAHEGALGKIKFSQDVQKNPLLKEGFLATLNKKYKADTDETGKVVPFTLDGKRIPHPSKAGAFMELDELYEHEAVSNKLIAQEQSTKFGSKLAVVSPEKEQQNGEPKRKTWKEL